MKINEVKILCRECCEIMNNDSMMDHRQYIFTCPVCKDQIRIMVDEK